jgi:hypothetical protein
VNSHMEDFYETSSKNPTEYWWSHKTLSWVESTFYCHVNSCNPNGHHCSYVTSHTCYKSFFFVWILIIHRPSTWDQDIYVVTNCINRHHFHHMSIWIYVHIFCETAIFTSVTIIQSLR